MEQEKILNKINNKKDYAEIKNCAWLFVACAVVLYILFCVATYAVG